MYFNFRVVYWWKPRFVWKPRTGRNLRQYNGFRKVARRSPAVNKHRSTAVPRRDFHLVRRPRPRFNSPEWAELLHSVETTELLSSLGGDHRATFRTLDFMLRRGEYRESKHCSPALCLSALRIRHVTTTAIHRMARAGYRQRRSPAAVGAPCIVPFRAVFFWSVFHGVPFWTLPRSRWGRAYCAQPCGLWRYRSV